MGISELGSNLSMLCIIKDNDGSAYSLPGGNTVVLNCIKFLTNAIQKFFLVSAVNLSTFLWVVNNFFDVEFSQKGYPVKIKWNGNVPS